MKNTNVRLTKLSKESQDELRNIFAANVFEPVVLIKKENVVAEDIEEMIIGHFMNVINTNDTDANHTTYEFNVNNRKVELYVYDTANINRTRKVTLVARVEDKTGVLTGNEELQATMYIDTVSGVTGMLSDIYSTCEYMINTIKQYATMEETPEEALFKDRVFRLIMSENSKFIAMKNIDPHYNERNAEAIFDGIKVELNLARYGDDSPYTKLRIYKGALGVETDIVGKLDISTIRKFVRETTERYLKEGGKI